MSDEERDDLDSRLRAAFKEIENRYFPTVPPVQHPCPSCGSCPTCGRGGTPYQPYYPHGPYWRITTGSTLPLTYSVELNRFR